MTPTENASPMPRDERVSALAYLIWEQEGRPEGKSDEHWFMACNIVDAEEAGTMPEGLPTWLSRAEPSAPETKVAPTAVIEKLPQQARSKSAA